LGDDGKNMKQGRESKGKKKKAGTGTANGAKHLSDYKTREGAGSANPVGIVVRRDPGTAKDPARKG
jgi:hypothetical protein